MRSRTGTWFTTKVRYQKTMEDGSEKIVTESYLVDALSFTEAESAIIDEMSVYVSGEFHVSGIAKANYLEICFSDGDDDDKWFKAKVSLIAIDEKSGKEKRNNVNYLVQAKSLQRALRYMEEMLGSTMQDWEIVGLSDTPLMDVFEHHSQSHKEERDDVPEYEQQDEPSKEENNG